MRSRRTACLRRLSSCHCPKASRRKWPSEHDEPAALWRLGPHSDPNVLPWLSWTRSGTSLRTPCRGDQLKKLVKGLGVRTRAQAELFGHYMLHHVAWCASAQCWAKVRGTRRKTPPTTRTRTRPAGFRSATHRPRHAVGRAGIREGARGRAYFPHQFFNHTHRVMCWISGTPIAQRPINPLTWSSHTSRRSSPFGVQPMQPSRYLPLPSRIEKNSLEPTSQQSFGRLRPCRA